MIPLDRLRHRLDQTLAAGALLRLPGAGVVELDAGPVGEVLDRSDEVDVVVLLHEREHVARLVAAEAAVAPGLLADVERRGALGMERAQADPVAAGALELHVLADHIDDRHGRADPLDVVVCDRHARNLNPAGEDRLTAHERSDEGHCSKASWAISESLFIRSTFIENPIEAISTIAITTSESHVGMWYHLWISIFTPTKARMIARPSCR